MTTPEHAAPARPDQPGAGDGLDWDKAADTAYEAGDKAFRVYEDDDGYSYIPYRQQPDYYRAVCRVAAEATVAELDRQRAALGLVVVRRDDLIDRHMIGYRAFRREYREVTQRIDEAIWPHAALAAAPSPGDDPNEEDNSDD